VKLTAISLIVGLPYRPGPKYTIAPGTVFERSDYDGDAIMLKAIDRAVKKGGCLVDGSLGGEIRKPDTTMMLKDSKGQIKQVDLAAKG
jgi:hypothetical protein